MPFTLHFTAVFALPLTVAAYCEELPRTTLVAPVRVRVTGPPPPGGVGGVVRVMARDCATEGSARLVAVMVTFEEPGVFAGPV
jgi:hypothetical protein